MAKTAGWLKPLAIEAEHSPASLDAYFKHVREALGDDMAFLRAPIAGRRAASNLVRGLAFLAVAAGLLLPVLDPDGWEWRGITRTGTEWAYIAVVVGGLILLADQVYNISRSWARLTLAELQIKHVIQELEFEWAKRRPAVVPANAAAEAPALIELLRKAASDAQKQTWTAEIEAARADLIKRLDESRVSLDEAARKQEEEAAKPKAGALNLTVDKPGDLIGPVQLLVDDTQKAKSDSVSASMGLVGIAPGQHNVEYRAKRKAAPQEDFRYAQVVTVKAGETAAMTVKV